MTLRTQLQKPLGRLMRKMISELGVLMDIRVPFSDRDSDGSALQDWRLVEGYGSPVRIFAAATTEQQLRQLWGFELKAEVTAIATMTPLIVGGMILRPNEGPFANRCFEVTKDLPDDIGQFVTLALTEVPAKPEYGF